MNIKITVLLALLIAVTAILPACAEEQEGGKDNFISNALSDVFDKLNQYSSGEKRIIYTEEEMKQEKDATYDSSDFWQREPKAAVKTGSAMYLDDSGDKLLEE